MFINIEEVVKAIKETSSMKDSGHKFNLVSVNTNVTALNEYQHLAYVIVKVYGKGVDKYDNNYWTYEICINSREADDAKLYWAYFEGSSFDNKFTVSDWKLDRVK